EALRRRAVVDHVSARVLVAEQLETLVEHVLGVADRILAAVGDVCDGELGAGLAEDPAECDGVLLVGGSVVGDDDLGGHRGGSCLVGPPAVAPVGRRPRRSGGWSLRISSSAHPGTVLPSAPMILLISIISSTNA